MLDKLVLILLGVYMLLVGVLTVTSLDVVWSEPIIGFAALACGIVCIVRALR